MASKIHHFKTKKPPEIFIMPIPQSGEQYLRLQADPNHVSVSVDQEAGIGGLLKEDILRSFHLGFFSVKSLMLTVMIKSI